MSDAVLFNNILQKAAERFPYYCSKVEYLQVSFLCNTGKTDMSDTIRKFYSQFNNIMSVLGKGSQEMKAVYLMKTYCLPTLTYGVENSAFCDNTRQAYMYKIQVIWNNCFRHIFSCCWRESVKPLGLQYSTSYTFTYSTSVILYHYPMLLIKLNYCSGKKCLSVIIRLYAVIFMVNTQSLYCCWQCK